MPLSRSTGVQTSLPHAVMNSETGSRKLCSCSSSYTLRSVELLLDEVLDGQVSKLLTTPQGWHRILREF